MLRVIVLAVLLLLGMFGCSIKSNGGSADIGLTVQGRRVTLIDVRWRPITIAVESDLLTALIRGSSNDSAER